MTESSLPRTKRPYKHHRKWFKNRKPIGTYVHLSTLEKGVRIIEESKKGLSMATIGKNMGLSRQRIYQIVVQAGLQDTLTAVYQRRIARKRYLKMRNKLRRCHHCGEEFVYIHKVTHRNHCKERCWKVFLKQRDRNRSRIYLSNPENRARSLARRLIKAKLDKS